jgi:hypothetical protein
MKPVTRACLGLAVWGLVGCGNLPIYNVEYNESYHAGETKAVPEVPVVVRGNPFAVPKAEFDNTVVNAMQGWSGSSDRFAVAANPNAPYRVIMVFNGATNNYTSGICNRPVAAEGAFGAPPSSQVPVAAALCRGDDYLSYISGSVVTAGGPDSADFRNGIGSATQSLFPVQNPTARTNRGCDHC